MEDEILGYRFYDGEPHGHRNEKLRVCRSVQVGRDRFVQGINGRLVGVDGLGLGCDHEITGSSGFTGPISLSSFLGISHVCRSCCSLNSWHTGPWR